MLDQNTTTVLTTLITVIGTLGGVVLGVVLSNRYVVRQEKAKRNNAIIEEVYTLINKGDNQIHDDIYNKNLENLLKMNDNIERIRTLIYLYLPSVRDNYTDYSCFFQGNPGSS